MDHSPTSAAAVKAAEAANSAVPVLNIAAFREAVSKGGDLTEDAKNVASQWRQAFSAQGFVQIVGHGVPDEVIEVAYQKGKDFFALPPEAKAKCDLGKGYGAGGYNARGVERVSASVSKPDGSELVGAQNARPPDLVESMVVKRLAEIDPIPEEVPGYEKAIHRYYDEMAVLLRTLMQLTAVSLDLPIDHFEPYFYGEGGVGEEKVIGDCSLRLAYYPALQEGQELLPNQIRYGEHTDYTGYTILWQDHNKDGPQTSSDNLNPPAGGLQVKMPDDTWTDCPPLPKAFTINAGDLIQAWTNDIYRSNLHRVMNPPADDRGDRLCLVYFTGPSGDTMIEALPTCVSPESPAKYAPISALNHLKRKLEATNK